MRKFNISAFEVNFPTDPTHRRIHFSFLPRNGRVHQLNQHTNHASWYWQHLSLLKHQKVRHWISLRMDKHCRRKICPDVGNPEDPCVKGVLQLFYGLISRQAKNPLALLSGLLMGSCVEHHVLLEEWNVQGPSWQTRSWLRTEKRRNGKEQLSRQEYRTKEPRARVLRELVLNCIA